MDFGPMNIDLTYTFANCFEVDIRIRRHANKLGIEQNISMKFGFANIGYGKHDYYVDYYYDLF